MTAHRFAGLAAAGCAAGLLLAACSSGTSTAGPAASDTTSVPARVYRHLPDPAWGESPQQPHRRRARRCCPAGFGHPGGGIELLLFGTAQGRVQDHGQHPDLAPGRRLVGGSDRVHRPRIQRHYPRTVRLAGSERQPRQRRRIRDIAHPGLSPGRGHAGRTRPARPRDLLSHRCHNTAAARLGPCCRGRRRRGR